MTEAGLATRYVNGVDTMQYTAEEIRQAKKSGAKRPRWKSEGMLGCKHVSESIVCTDCMFRFIEIDGKKIERSDAGDCEIYEYPESKPNDVYFDGAECEYYEKDE